MFIGHLPAGYMATTALLRGRELDPAQRRAALTAGMVASVLPDVDMLYFYLIDGQQHLHHSYWTHIPLAWIGIACLAWLIRPRSHTFLALILLVNVLLHLLLDTFVGGIQWFAPWSHTYITLVEVPARYDQWVLNFILHWSFILELLICLAALAVYRRKTVVKKVK